MLDIYFFVVQILFLWLGVIEYEETYAAVILQQSVEVRQESERVIKKKYAIISYNSTERITYFLLYG